MQPLKISINGDFIDCQIYRGRLYLWTLDGQLKVYSWNSIVNSLVAKEIDRITFEYSFLDGSYLYKKEIIDLIDRDIEFKTLLEKKFNRIAKLNLEINERELEKFLIGQQDTPLNIIPTDTEIYGNDLYYITEKGFYFNKAHTTSKKYPVSSKSHKLWDCNLLSIKANRFPQIALSGGNEGLYEYNMSKNIDDLNLKRAEKDSPIFLVSRKHSSFSNYNYANLYNSSVASDSFMAYFNWKVTNDELLEKKTYSRQYEREISEGNIFNGSEKNNLSWGLNEKIFRVYEKGFEVVNFNGFAKEEKGESKFTLIDTIESNVFNGRAISGSSVYFGNVVEYENSLVILLVDGSRYVINQPVTRWRVYPRSLNYQNHLHVILEDKIEVYSFNQDYFQQQKAKTLGIEFVYPKQYSHSSF